MKTHDELCPIPRGVGPTGCHCDLIAQVVEREQKSRYRRLARDRAAAISGAREQERVRIAQAIEEQGSREAGVVAVAFADAAWIARNGGRDE